MAGTVDSEVGGTLNLAATQQEKLHLPCLETNGPANDAETCTVDSGIAESSDHASSISAPDSPNQPFFSCIMSSSAVLEEGEFDLAISKANTDGTHSNETVSETVGDTNSHGSTHIEKPSLLECLEPRPPGGNGGEEVGGVSPKEVHRQLMKKVQCMSSNGHQLSNSSDSTDGVMEPRNLSPAPTPSPTPTAAIPTQQRSWSLTFPFLKKCV